MGRPRSVNGAENAAQIVSDAISAHEKGISYGEYKAGLSEKRSGTGYTVSQDGHVKMSEKKNAADTQIAKAFIRVR